MLLLPLVHSVRSVCREEPTYSKTMNQIRSLLAICLHECASSPKYATSSIWESAIKRVVLPEDPDTATDQLDFVRLEVSVPDNTTVELDRFMDKFNAHLQSQTKYALAMLYLVPGKIVAGFRLRMAAATSSTKKRGVLGKRKMMISDESKNNDVIDVPNNNSSKRMKPATPPLPHVATAKTPSTRRVSWALDIAMLTRLSDRGTVSALDEVLEAPWELASNQLKTSLRNIQGQETPQTARMRSRRLPSGLCVEAEGLDYVTLRHINGLISTLKVCTTYLHTAAVACDSGTQITSQLFWRFISDASLGSVIRITQSDISSASNGGSCGSYVATSSVTDRLDETDILDISNNSSIQQCRQLVSV